MNKKLRLALLCFALATTVISCSPKQQEAKTASVALDPADEALGVKLYENAKLDASFKYDKALTMIDEAAYKADKAAIEKLYDDNKLDKTDLSEKIKGATATFYKFTPENTIYPTRISFANVKNVIFKAMDINDPEIRAQINKSVYDNISKQFSDIKVDDTFEDIEVFGVKYATMKFTTMHKEKNIPISGVYATTIKGSVSNTFIFFSREEDFEQDYPMLYKMISTSNFGK